MRTSFLCTLALFLLASSALAGRLDLAVIEFSGPRDPDALAAALRTCDLSKVTDSDRTETKDSALQAGWVIFTQSFGISGGRFANSTRLANQRADVSGSLEGSHLSVEVTTLEGVKIGLRKYRETHYAGDGSVAGGVPRILSIKQIKSKTANSYGQVLTKEFTSVLVARYTP
jgi:hypothetical protein